MSISATHYARNVQAFPRKNRCVNYALLTLLLATACVTDQTAPVQLPPTDITQEAQETWKLLKPQIPRETPEARESEETLRSENAEETSEAGESDESLKLRNARETPEARESEETLKSENAEETSEAGESDESLKLRNARETPEARESEEKQEKQNIQETQKSQSQLNSTEATSNSVPLAPGTSTQSTALPDTSIPENSKIFALDLIELMGTSPGKCGVAAQNTPQVNWTCAEYTSGLGTFIAKWDKLITSEEVSLNHSYIATSDWMYFAIDGEIDFFWKTYDLDTTQVLVAYDPSEKGNELIIGLNSTIGDQIAAANGSHSFTNPSQSSPSQE